MKRLPKGKSARWFVVFTLLCAGAAVAGCGGGGGGGGAPPDTLDPNNPLAGSSSPVDRAALATLTSLGISSSKLCDDTEFLRRVTADIAGRFPTEAEIAAFTSDTSSPMDRRARVIDGLLASADFPYHWSRDVIGPWFGVHNQQDSFDNAVGFDISQDVPLAQMVDAICTGNAPQFDATFPVAYEKVDRIVLAFTGMTSECARCHDHKLTTVADDPRFLQDDNYALYAFFATSNNDATKLDLSGKRFGKPVDTAFVLDGYANAPNPQTLPKLADPVGARRQAFSALLRQSNVFARGTSHRIWAELKSPLLDPNQFLRANLDAMTAPAVLDALTQEFKNSNTQLKVFLHRLMTSRLYQLSSEAAFITTAVDGIARHKMRRHHAEVVEQGYTQLAGVAFQQNDFLRANFGYPGTRVAINERSDDVNSSQSALIMNSDSVAGVVSSGSTLDRLSQNVDNKVITLSDAIVKLFRLALSRDPSSDELAMVLSEAKQCQAQRSTRDALEDVAAGIMASIEFVGH